MAVATGQVAVTSSAQSIVTTGAGTVAHVATIILVNTGATTVYIGASTVTTTTGLPLAAGAALTLDFVSPNDLYAVAASSGTVCFLYERV